MTIENLSAGLQILLAHGATGYTLGAEHDVLYVADAREVKMPLREIRKLYKLGWMIDKENESWYLFT